MFKILFDFRGKIDRKQYLNGITVVLFATLIAVFYHALDRALVIPLFQQGSEQTAKWTMVYGRLTYHYQPAFIPYGFIVFYSCLVLSIKRVREFGWNRVPGFLLGLLVFLAFRSALNIPYILFLLDGRGVEPFLASDLLFMLIVSVAFMLSGLVVVVGLSWKRSSAQTMTKRDVNTLFSFRGKLDDYDFTSQVGRLLAWSLSIGVGSMVIATLAVFFQWRQDLWSVVLIALNSVSSLIIGILYVFAGIRRLRSIGLKGRWFVISLLLINLIMAIMAMVLFSTENTRLMYGLINIGLLTMGVFWALQFLLFITPADYRLSTRLIAFGNPDSQG